MANEPRISMACIEVTQPIGTFYIGAIDSADLLKISYADVRRIVDRDVEVLSGIERPLSPKRIAELRKYVTAVDASFPTSVILAVSSEHAHYDAQSHTMSISADDNVAKIIDGQHRIDGLRGYTGPKFQLNVTIFVDMDMEEQALLFSTINLKQTPVGKSLAYDLFDFARSRSPQKTCHNIARLLSSKDGSPFYHKIMILGRATGRPEETITQAAFVDGLMPFVSTDPMSDRDALKRGRELPPADLGEVRVRRLIFRNFFIKDQDADIARNLWNYFAAVKARWPEAWEERQAGLILNRTTGFRALMRFLPNAYLTHGGLGAIVSEDAFRQVVDKVRLSDTDFTPDNFKPGTSGQSALYKKFVADTRLDDSAIWRTGRR